MYLMKINKVYSGENLTFDELMFLSTHMATEELLLQANKVREYFHGNQIELCAAMNLKSGKCNEDCRYCSQSAFYNTDIPVYPMQDPEAVWEFATYNQNKGVTNFELSTSGGYLSKPDRKKLLEIYQVLSQKTSMRLCGAHGKLENVEEAIALKEAGLKIYQHNLQAGRSYFTKVITTHTYDERLNTLKYAKQAGLTICSGGVIGVGEQISDRLEMVMDLQELGIASMPVNILNPIPGTPLGDQGITVTPEEIFRSVALFRLALPKAKIIYGAGRLYLQDKQFRAFESGLNGIVIGNFLTTKGACIEEDIEMMQGQNFVIRNWD